MGFFDPFSGAADVGELKSDLSSLKSDVETHTNNNDIHVTASDKSNWDSKLDKNQGTENSGKVLGTNANGEVIPLNGYGFEYDEETKMLKYGTDPTSNLNQGIGLDDTLSKRGYAADAGAVGELKEDLNAKTEELSYVTNGLQDQIDDIRTISTQSTWTWVMSHISTNGKLTPNNNKNIVFENPVYATANSTISVDTGYKYQYALYDKDTGAFIIRVAWKTDATTLNADYKIRVEISDLSESVLTDYSIAEHLHANIYSSYVPTKTKVIENSANIERIESTVFEFEKEDKNALRQSNNIVNAIGIDSFKEKVLEVAEPTAYKAWSFVGVAGGKLICLYSVGKSHTDTKSSINYKTSENGVIWSSEREIISTDSQRDNVTGKGYDNDGNFIFWVRRGNPGASTTKFELYKTVDGNTFEMVSSNLFATAKGHIGDIVNVEGHGMFAFWNNYGDTRSWGYVKSTDNGVTWTETTIEVGQTKTDCPVEMSPVYLGNGKILVIGRQDWNGNYGMFQIQSDDYCETFTKSSCNINHSGATPSILYDSNTDTLSLYYFVRASGELKLITTLSTTIWDNPTSWDAGTVIATVDGRGADAGNVNACKFGDLQIASFYSGKNPNTGVYLVIE